MNQLRTALSRYTSSPAQKFAFFAGFVYVLTGTAGFALIGLGHFPLLPRATLVIFGVNPLHNAIHFVVGMVWILAASSLAIAKRANMVIGLVFGTLTILGLLRLLGFLGVSGISDPDNFLHLASAALALYFATVGSEAAGSSDSKVGAKTRTVVDQW